MQSIAMSRLHWKEFRTQGVIWLALFAMCAMFAVAVVALVDPDSLGLAMDSLIFAGPTLFALACGSFAFASEDEAGTVSVLRRLPLGSRDVLRAKIGFGLMGLLLFYFLFAILVWAVAYQLRPRLISIPGHFHYAFWGFEALLWSAFFSMRTRSSFASAIWGAVLVGVTTYIFELLGTRGVAMQVAAYALRILVLAYVAARLIPQSDEWFHDFEIPSRPLRHPAILSRIQRLPRDIGRILWLTWRENRTLILIAVGLAVILLLVARYLYLQDQWHDLEELARGNVSGYDPIALLPAGLNFFLASTIGVSLLCAALGLVVFGTVRQMSGVTLLVQKGFRPQFVALVRVAFLGSLSLLACIGLHLEILSATAWAMAYYDGQRIINIILLLPAWVFVASLWTSLHTKKKVIAYFAGIILGCVAAAQHFVFLNASIAPWWWRHTVFFWFAALIIGSSILLTGKWAHRHWGFTERLASWSILPLGLIAIYAGVATYRIYDVPNVSRLTARIAKPKGVPLPVWLTAENPIDLKQILGEHPSDPMIANIFYRNADNRRDYWAPSINHDYFSEWSTTDESSIKYQAGLFDAAELTYQCFLRFEPTIVWARDKVIAEDCEVNFSVDRGGPENWYLVGAYAKLKEGKPDESLRYIHALIRTGIITQNSWFHSHERRMRQPFFQPWPVKYVPDNREYLPAIAAWNPYESIGLEMMRSWANHPLVKMQPALIEEAIGLIPEPDLGRDIDSYGIEFLREWRKSRPNSELNTWFLRFPVDGKVKDYGEMLLPWETMRRQILIEQAADLAVKVRNDPSIRTRVEAMAEMRRYRNPFGDFFNANFDKLAELRVSTKQKLEQALAEATKTKE